MLILGILAFAAVMAVLRYLLVRREREGDFDPQSPSSAAIPGLRRLFDYSSEGFKHDGSRQRPPQR